VNDKLYTHEYIDIIRQNRAKYMHHMTANWNPISVEERDQLCFGVWGTIGSTGRWPEVVNLWEHNHGFDGLAFALGHETGRPTLQDPKLEKWWAEAAGYRRGGFDRILAPAPWTRTITELCEAGVRGDLYAHETVKVAPWTAGDFLSSVADVAVPAHESFGLELVGAFRTTMHDDSECTLIWAIPTWQHWAEFERAFTADSALRPWVSHLRDAATAFERFVMVEAPLSPMRIGRQPAREDRAEGWSDL
jgi:hypothetical protein